MADQIIIKRLLISTHIGVPDEERAEAQQLCVSVKMTPSIDFSEVNDDIEKTVDYYQVSLRIKALAAAKPRKLIETLGEEIAQMILAEFDVNQVEIEIEKYILTDADHVGVHLTRSRS